MAKEQREKAAAMARKREQRAATHGDEKTTSSMKNTCTDDVVKEREEVVKEICEAEVPKREIPKLSEEEARKAALGRVRQHRRKHDTTAPDHLEVVRQQLFDRRDKRIEKFQQDQELRKEHEKTNPSSSSRPSSAKTHNESQDRNDFDVHEDVSAPAEAPNDHAPQRSARLRSRSKPSVPTYQNLKTLKLTRPEIEKEKQDEMSYAERHGSQAQKAREEEEARLREEESRGESPTFEVNLANTAKEKVYVPVELMQSDDSGLLDKMDRENYSSPTRKLSQNPLAQTGVGVLEPPPGVLLAQQYQDECESGVSVVQKERVIVPHDVIKMSIDLTDVKENVNGNSPLEDVVRDIKNDRVTVRSPIPSSQSSPTLPLKPPRLSNLSPNMSASRMSDDAAAASHVSSDRLSTEKPIRLSTDSSDFFTHHAVTRSLTEQVESRLSAQLSSQVHGDLQRDDSPSYDSQQMVRSWTEELRRSGELRSSDELFFAHSPLKHGILPAAQERAQAEQIDRQPEKESLPLTEERERGANFLGKNVSGECDRAVSFLGKSTCKPTKDRSASSSFLHGDPGDESPLARIDGRDMDDSYDRQDLIAAGIEDDARVAEQEENQQEDEGNMSPVDSLNQSVDKTLDVKPTYDPLGLLRIVGNLTRSSKSASSGSLPPTSPLKPVACHPMDASKLDASHLSSPPRPQFECVTQPGQGIQASPNVPSPSLSRFGSAGGFPEVSPSQPEHSPSSSSGGLPTPHFGHASPMNRDQLELAPAGNNAITEERLRASMKSNELRHSADSLKRDLRASSDSFKRDLRASQDSLDLVMPAAAKNTSLAEDQHGSDRSDQDRLDHSNRSPSANTKARLTLLESSPASSRDSHRDELMGTQLLPNPLKMSHTSHVSSPRSRHPNSDVNFGSPAICLSTPNYPSSSFNSSSLRSSSLRSSSLDESTKFELPPKLPETPSIPQPEATNSTKASRSEISPYHEKDALENDEADELRVSTSWWWSGQQQQEPLDDTAAQEAATRELREVLEREIGDSDADFANPFSIDQPSQGDEPMRSEPKKRNDDRERESTIVTNSRDWDSLLAREPSASKNSTQQLENLQDLYYPEKHTIPARSLSMPPSPEQSRIGNYAKQHVPKGEVAMRREWTWPEGMPLPGRSDGTRSSGGDKSQMSAWELSPSRWRKSGSSHSTTES